MKATLIIVLLTLSLATQVQAGTRSRPFEDFRVGSRNTRYGIEDLGRMADVFGMGPQAQREAQRARERAQRDAQRAYERQQQLIARQQRDAQRAYGRAQYERARLESERQRAQMRIELERARSQTRQGDPRIAEAQTALAVQKLENEKLKIEIERLRLEKEKERLVAAE